jgi:formate dehydrogenase major subunit
MELTRRGFVKITCAGLAASSLGALGFGSTGQALAAAVRPFKLMRASKTATLAPIALLPAVS